MVNQISLKEIQEEFPWLLNDEATHGTIYDPALIFAKQKNKELCDKYFAAMVSVSVFKTGDACILIENLIRSNIGYWAGYYSLEDRENVIEFYNAHHPFLPLNCTSEEALQLGIQAAKLYEIEKQLRNEIKK